MENIKIRFAQPQDIEALLELCHLHAIHERAEISTDLLNATSLSQLLFSGETSVACLVVEIEGSIDGYATFSPQYSTWGASKYMYLDCLYLKESARGHRLGFAMMQRVREEARKEGCKHIQWQTPTFNRLAIDFYERLGATAKPKQRFEWSVESDSIVTNRQAILGPPASLTAPYLPRSTRMTEVRALNDWQLKTYQITIDDQPIATEILEAAFHCVLKQTVWPNGLKQRYGFFTLHRSEHGTWALVQLWVNDILRQFIFFAPFEAPTHFATSPTPGFNACVWGLKVTSHERDAWVRHVLANPATADFDKYLSDSLKIDLINEQSI
ncbi:MAG: GNAT family N-acetyltransferase [Planctomycetota bacterium]